MTAENNNDAYRVADGVENTTENTTESNDEGTDKSTVDGADTNLDESADQSSDESSKDATQQAAEEEEAADAPDLDKLKKIVEGAIFAAAKPMTIDNLGALFVEEERPSKESFATVLNALMEEYADRGVMLKEVASGFRFQVREDVGMWVSRLWEEKPARYSRALLETLALIAYRQPITRGEIEEIRGVSTSSNIMKTLQERDWIRVVGHRDVPGRPAMYATTRQFLDYFSLQNIDELPSLAEIRDLDEINRELDLQSDEAMEKIQSEAMIAAEGSGEQSEEDAQPEASPENPPEQSTEEESATKDPALESAADDGENPDQSEENRYTG